MSASLAWVDWSCHVGLTLDHGSSDRARAIVTDLMRQVEAAISRFRPDSELARINGGAGRLVPVGALTVKLVDVAIDAARRSNGLVDPTLGRQIIECGYHDDIDRVRGTARPVGAALPGGQWRSIRIDRALRLVGVPAGVALDLGATAKAWTVDEAARRVADRLGSACLVEIGGDISAAAPRRGERSDPRWRVDVQERRGEPGTRVDLRHGAIATSSIRARRWTSDEGGPMHHLIDPRTGRPSSGPWRTASVWAHDAVAANTASTAAIIAGVDAPTVLNELQVAARLVDLDGHIVTVGDWPQEIDAEDVAA